MQRARFNNELNGDLAGKIFCWLDKASRWMARSVCRDWRTLIAPRKIHLFDFITVCKLYGGSDVYMRALEQHSHFRASCLMYNQCISVALQLVHDSCGLGLQLFLRVVPHITIDKKSIHSDGLGYSLVKTITAMNDKCIMDECLLPVVNMKAKSVNQIFWQAVATGDTLLACWMVDHYFVTLNAQGLQFLGTPCITSHLWDYNRCFATLQHMHNYYQLGREFWCTFIDMLYRKDAFNGIAARAAIEVCQFVPVALCDLLKNGRLGYHDEYFAPFHDTIRHVCGCAKKKQKKSKK